MSRNLFGTDGIRGRANIEPVTAETALAVAKATGLEFRRGNHSQAQALATALADRYRRRALGHSLSGDLHMLAGEFAEAANAYASAQARSNRRDIAMKRFSAALTAGLDNPTAALAIWLTDHPDDAQIRRVARAAGGAAD